MKYNDLTFAPYAPSAGFARQRGAWSETLAPHALAQEG